MPDLARNTELMVREVEQLRITITALQKALIRNDSEFMDIEQASLLLTWGLAVSIANSLIINTFNLT